MYTIERVTQKEVWEKYLSTRPEANFLQSWNWGRFHASLGKNVYYLHILEGEQITGCALIVCEKAKRGSYLTVAGGPLLHWQDSNIDAIFAFFISEVKKIAATEKAAFMRIRIQEEANIFLTEMMKRHKLVLAPMHLTADRTIQLDLTKSEDETLAQMRKNTRYEIRRAQKEDIRTVISGNPEEIRAFFQTQLEVATRQKFVPFSYDFLHKQFLAFLEDDQVKLIHAFKGDTLLASAFVIFYGTESVYHYGISTNDNAKLPGSYACQWAAILESKRRGMTRYNLWGVNPKDEVDHRFAGVGLFKRGFGGVEVEYLPAYDFPFGYKYHAVKMFELIRKKMRKL